MDLGPDQNQFKFVHSDVPGKEFKHGHPRRWPSRGTSSSSRTPVPGDGRFRLLKVEERDVLNERINVTERQKFALIEDLKENKKGDKFEIPRRMPDAEAPKFVRRDRTAVLELRGRRLRPANRSRSRSASPSPCRLTLPRRTVFLKEVTDDSVTVEFADESGQKQTVVIPKGGFPDLKL